LLQQLRFLFGIALPAATCYKFTAAAEDNGANLVCEAKNLLATTPLRAELNLTVLCKFLWHSKAIKHIYLTEMPKRTCREKKIYLLK